MTDSQSHIVGTWTLNLCFSKGPVSFSRQVSSCLLFILLSVMLTPLSFFSLNPFNLLSFPFRFILLAPLRLLSSIYLSLLPWPLFIYPPLAFPSCKMPPQLTPIHHPFFAFFYSLSIKNPSLVFSQHSQIFHWLPLSFSVSDLKISLMFLCFHEHSPSSVHHSPHWLLGAHVLIQSSALDSRTL